MSKKKEMGKIKDAAEAMGYTLHRRAKSGHTMWKHPNGALVTLGGTPSDYRSYENQLSELRKGARGADPQE